MDVKNILFELCEAPGPSGIEGPVTKRAAELLGRYMDSVDTDRLGNVIGKRLCGKKNAKKLVLDAHLDEIGLIITGFEDGFLRFETLGGVDPRMLVAKEVKILAKEPLYGIISCLPPHVQDSEDMNKAFSIDKLYIDTGMDEKQAKEQIHIGARAIYSSKCIELYKDCVSGKAMDDRACFVSILRACELLFEKNPDVDIYVLGSVQEETGCRGAKAGIFSINPDFCVCVDVTHAKTPDAPKDRTFEAGGGPAVGIGPNMDRTMSERLMSTADKKGIKYQLEIMEGNSGTNAWPIQISREGVKTAVLSIPVKYMHSPVETMSLFDLEKTAELLSEFVLSFSEEARDNA